MNPNANRWLELYNDGLTHEQISLDHGEGYSTTTVGNALRKHPDYVPRPVSGKGGGNKHRGGPENDRPSGKPSIKTVVRPGAYAAHRHRGRGW